MSLALKSICFLISVFLSLFGFVLWQKGMIDLPAAVVHSARIFQASILAGREPQATKKLEMPFHRQEHALSCEAASLKTALGAYGLDVAESDILKVLPFDLTPRSKGVWGDPNKGFVGNIDGKMFADGYGVHWDPIARVGLRWKRTEVLRNASPADLAEHIMQGHPVIIWGYLGRGLRGSWRTPEGKEIDAINGEHTRVVYGFSGSVVNPDGFFLVDPIYGHKYWQKDDFLKNWDGFGRMGVAVYPYPRWVRTEGDYRVWEISKDGKTRTWLDMTWDEFEAMGGFEEAIQVES